MPKSSSGPKVTSLWTARLTYGFLLVFYVDTDKLSLQNKWHSITTPAVRVLMGSSTARGLPGRSKWGDLVNHFTLAIWKVFFCFSPESVECCPALAGTLVLLCAAGAHPFHLLAEQCCWQVLLPFLDPLTTLGCLGPPACRNAGNAGKNTHAWQKDNPDLRQCWDLQNFPFRSKCFHLSPEILKEVGERVPGVIWAPGMSAASRGLRGVCASREEEKKPLSVQRTRVSRFDHVCRCLVKTVEHPMPLAW